MEEPYFIKCEPNFSPHSEGAYDYDAEQEMQDTEGELQDAEQELQNLEEDPLCDVASEWISNRRHLPLNPVNKFKKVSVAEGTQSPGSQSSGLVLPQSSNLDSSTYDKSLQQKNELSSSTHICTICGKEFGSASELKEHSVVHAECTFYSCSLCERRYTEVEEVWEHILTHPEYNLYSCTKCSKESSNPNCPQAVNCTCEICRQVFTCQCYLQMHLKLHQNKAQFTCSLCNKECYFKSKLQGLAVTHPRSKDYVCRLCNIAICKKRNKSKFRSSPYSVKKGKSTSKACGKEEHKPYGCALCGELFSHIWKTNEHILSHKGQKSFTCVFCKKEFNESDAIKRHMKLFHEEERKGCFFI